MNDLTKKPTNEVALNDFADVGATGFENVDASDLLIPRLTILQGLSPQVIKGNPEYDEKARVGDIYDIGLQERFPDGVEVIVAHYDKAWLEWSGSRGSTRPPVIHETADILAETRPNDMGQPALANGNTIAETAQFYVLNLTAGRRKSFIPMSITQLKKARRLLTLAQSERILIPNAQGIEEERVPPLFWRSYFLTTVLESNAKGSWSGWKIERGPLVKDRDDYKIILKEIKDLREAVQQGRARGDLGAGEESGGERAF